jgi:threonine/homoserine/homoserine lactone efflux protein
MTPEIWTVYLVTAAVLTITPGLDTAMVLRTSAMQGARQGMFAAFGIGLGCLCWGSAAAFGLGAVLAASPTAFLILKLVGAGYLAWLGIGLLLHPRRSFEHAAAPVATESDVRRAFLRGFATNILNPKVGIFYVTLLPQFVPQDAPPVPSALELAVAHVALAVAWFCALAAITGSVRPYLRRPRVLAVLDRVTGGVFLGFGLQLTLGH